MALSFVILGISVVVLGNYISYKNSAANLEANSREKFIHLTQMRAKEIDQKFSLMGAQARILSSNNATIEAIEKFSMFYDKKLKPNISLNAIHSKYHPSFSKYVEEYNYFNVFLINMRGTVIYSAVKDAALGTNVLTDLTSLNKLKDIFIKATNPLDKQPYIMVDGHIAHPIIVNDRIMGVVALRMDSNALRDLSTNTDATEVSLSSPNEVINATASTSLISLAERHGKTLESFSKIIDDHGSEVFISSQSLKISNLHWRLIAARKISDVIDGRLQLKIFFALQTLASLLILSIVALAMANIFHKRVKSTQDALMSQIDFLKTSIDETAAVQQNLNHLAQLQVLVTGELVSQLDDSSQLVHMQVDLTEALDIVLKTCKQAVLLNQGNIQEIDNAVGEIELSANATSLTMQENNKIMQRMAKVIADIEVKAKSMDEIVFQANLLSFNASVEAKKNGKAGKSFVLIAQEVENIAKRCNRFSKEIARCFRENIEKIEVITNLSSKKNYRLINIAQSKNNEMRLASIKSQHGSAEVLNSIENLRQVVNQVRYIAKEQANAVQKLNRKCERSAQIVQENLLLLKPVELTRVDSEIARTEKTLDA